MQTISQTLPHYKKLVLEDNPAAVSRLDLNEVERQKVLQMCSLLASPCSPQWVSLVASWGFDLNAPALSAHEKSGCNWLWNALAHGNFLQALALVRLGFTSIDLDKHGRSGLGALIQETFYDERERVLDLLAELETLGLSWTAWPDALDFDDQMRKNVGSSLGELMSERASRLLQDCPQSSFTQETPIRL